MRRGIREVEKKRETGGRSLYSVMYVITLWTARKETGATSVD